ncbi:MAG: TOBE domain-containing protein, partial [Bdellovibrionaceae bacterium]|nr:TOBE domain-containing protein [Pseudobdellovibrionaceae bacterium]
STPANPPSAKALAGSPRRHRRLPSRARQPAGAAENNAIESKVLHASYLGSKSQAVLQTSGGQEIKAWLPDHPTEGDCLRITIDPARILKFP